MRARRCHRHTQGEDSGKPCSCEMGNLYRFAEPIVLLAIARLGEAHGYQLAQEAGQMAVTHAGLDGGIIYRTLRRLEAARHVRSSWETSGPGPARRIYVLTDSGKQHLAEWAEVLKSVSRSLQALTRGCEQAIRQPASGSASRGRARAA